MKTLAAFLCIAIIFPATLIAQSNPVPFVNQPLVPVSIAPGGPGFTLTVNGTGFVSGSTVNWNGSPRTTTFISGSQLTASILSSDIISAMTASVTVTSPTPGGGTSSVVFMPVREPSTFVSMNTGGFASAEDAQQFAVGDFNKDGNQDMAIVQYAPSTGTYSVQVELGIGDGTFTQAANYALPNGPAVILTGDLRGSGNLDLILTNLRDPQNNNVALAAMLGNGDGTFQPLVFSDGPACCATALGDFNRDGTIDVVVLNNGNQVCVFPGNGNGSFQSAICNNMLPSGNFFYLSVGDFNRDGKLDLALTGEDNNNAYHYVIMLGNGDGTFQTPLLYPLPHFPEQLTTADFNGDGILDLVIDDYTMTSVLVYLGKGDGSFSGPTAFPTALGPYSTLVGDMNGDGKLDLVVPGYGLYIASMSVLLGNGDGTFQGYTDYDASSPNYFGVADLNNDGRLDVAVTSILNGNSSVVTLLQDNGSAIRLSTNKLFFPTQLVGTVSPPQAIHVTNTGTSPVTVSNFSITQSFSQLNNCTTVQPGRSCEVAVYFTPIGPGNIIGYLGITDNGGGSPQIINLSGTATILSITPSSLNFGDVKVGKISNSQNITVTNEGNGSVTVSEIAIGGTDAKDFSQVNACPPKLGTGASCTITVLFHPMRLGERNAILGIFDTGGGSPQKVPLTGNGT